MTPQMLPAAMRPYRSDVGKLFVSHSVGRQHQRHNVAPSTARLGDAPQGREGTPGETVLGLC